MKKKSELQSLEMLLQVDSSARYAKENLRGKPFGVIYTRVSSAEQVSNSSLGTQMKLCEDYALRHGISIKRHFGGKYESAKTDGREEFQKMLAFVKKDKDISFIIVYNYDRFSRTGPEASVLSASLRKIGVNVKAVLQDIDTSTASGRLQETVFHAFNHFDNQTKAERTKVNTREVLMQGYWTYGAPVGYTNLKPKHKAYEHEYIINDDGKLLKKAFQLKAEGVLTNRQIIEKLSLKGLKITEKNIRWIFSNVFYAGYVTGKLVDGKLIPGKHPALVDLKTFLKANNRLMEAANVGVAKKAQRDDLPLKIFAKEELTGTVLTGYLKKGNWYYKTKGVKLNVSAKKLNAQFESLLRQFEFKNEYKSKLKALLYQRLKGDAAEQIEEARILKKNLREIETQLEKVEERYALGSITKELYEKHGGKFLSQIAEIKGQLEKKSFESSNLDFVIEKSFQILENLTQAWISSKYVQKQKLQYLLFPEGILYNKKDDSVRTQRINSVFAAIPQLTRDLEENERDNSLPNCLFSDSVAPTRIELVSKV